MWLIGKEVSQGLNSGLVTGQLKSSRKLPGTVKLRDLTKLMHITEVRDWPEAQP